MFMLVSRRYERASLIVTSNKPFSAWGEIFGDDVVAAAMIDRLVHHAEILALKGDSYRLKDRDLARPTSPTPATEPRATSAAPARPTGSPPRRPPRHPPRGSVFNRRYGVHFRPALTAGPAPDDVDVHLASTSPTKAGVARDRASHRSWRLQAGRSPRVSALRRASQPVHD